MVSFKKREQDLFSAFLKGSLSVSSILVVREKMREGMRENTLASYEKTLKPHG